MSVILDALKKLDREKSSRRNGTTNIAVEILRPDLTRPRKRILLYFAAVSFATAAITYVVMVEFGSLSKLSPPALISPPAPTQEVVPVVPESGLPSKPLPPAPVSPPAATQEVAPVAPEAALPSKSLPAAPVSPPAKNHHPTPATLSRERVHDVQDKAGLEPSQIQAPVETKIPVETEILEENKIPVPAPDKEEAVETDIAPDITKKPAERTPNVSAMTPPSLRVSGIVWREEPSERLAVINGTVLREGSEIGGAKVEEIHPTRVRFSHNDRSFEISLGSSLVISE